MSNVEENVSPKRLYSCWNGLCLFYYGAAVPHLKGRSFLHLPGLIMISEGGKEGGWKGGGGGRKGLLVSVQKLKNIYVDSSDFIFLWYETDPTIQNSAF